MLELKYTPEGYPADCPKFVEEARKELDRHRDAIARGRHYLRNARRMLLEALARA